MSRMQGFTELNTLDPRWFHRAPWPVVQRRHWQLRALVERLAVAHRANYPYRKGQEPFMQLAARHAAIEPPKCLGCPECVDALHPHELDERPGRHTDHDNPPADYYMPWDVEGVVHGYVGRHARAVQ